MLKPFKINENVFFDLSEVQLVKRHNKTEITIFFKDDTYETITFATEEQRDMKFDELYTEFFHTKGLPMWAKEQAKRRREKENEDNLFRSR